jgi:hypothetical protein
VSVHVPASQHAPLAQEEIPAQCTPQVVPPQCVDEGHALTPVQVTVLFRPRAVTPPGHAEAPVHVTLQVSAEQLTPDVHELEPHVTVQLEPPQETAEQLDAAAQSTVHEPAEEQSTATAPPTVTLTSQARPAGHAHGPDEHVIVHTPASHVPPVQAAAHAAAS